MTANLVYTQLGDSPQALDVYRPAGEAPEGGWPVILAIHGGGWWRFSKNQYGPKVASAFIPDGYAVVAPNYQLASSQNPSWPVNLDQLRDAVRWVKSHAAEFGFDPRRIVAMGESAGGHLAAALGNEEGSAAVSAVVDFFGPVDLPRLARENPVAAAAAEQMLGVSLDADPGRYAAASPALQVTPNSAPALIIHGAKDWLVNWRQSQELADALTRAGVANRLILIPNGQHGLGFRSNGQDLTLLIRQFLDEVLPTTA